METIKYQKFNETLFTERLSNGLQVNLLPRPEFHQTYGILTARYGSINNKFIRDGKLQHYPNGIAHFLEHKLFEKEDHDAFDEFAKYGADSNAFTSFTRTSYLFSTSQNIAQCVSSLLDFVQHPFFSTATVEKEKGIIAQEIKMYEDDASWQLLFGVMQNLYPQTALTADIAGSVSSIQQITPEMLYENYHAFYQPGNMSLMLVGNFDLEKIMNLIRKSQAEIQSKPVQIKRVPLFEKKPLLLIKTGTKRMNIMRPKLGIAVRGDCQLDVNERMQYKVALQLLLEMLFGESSSDFQYLYDAGIIDNSFGYEIQLEEDFHFVYFSMDTAKVQEANDAIREILLNAGSKIKQQEKIFELMKREFIGRYLKGMNSNENIADQFDQWLFGNQIILDAISAIQNLSIDDLIKLAEQLFKAEQITEFQILPKEQK